jgi:2-polyprenyl-3-methyl-5-hydroxy-6-metoxy-1,4-benzoquinol methylase
MVDFVKWFFGDKVKYEDDPDNIQGHYDYITSNSVLEHLPDPIKVVKMFGEHLNPKGQIIVSMATDIHGQHLKKAIDRYNEVISLVAEINQKSKEKI